VREEGGVILGEVSGEAEVGVVKRQVERILSLDADGVFPEVGQRDSVVGRLQARYPSLRPVCFSSPYEAAAWALIGQRIRIVQAAKIKNRMASELGPTVEVHGRSEHAFPGPKRLAALDSFPGLTARKVEYLRQLGCEAAEEKFDAAYLRSLPEREALAQLEKLPGIGPFSAGFILLRGAGTLDLLPTREPRFGSAVAMAYDLDAPPNAGRATALVPAMASLQNMGKPAPASHARRRNRRNRKIDQNLLQHPHNTQQEQKAERPEAC
jgi:DNA-3-methyladenine glycosylase II